MRVNAYATLLILWILLFMPGIENRVQAQSPTPQEVCEHYIDRLFAEPNWREQLINPVFTRPEQILERYSLYWPVYDCLMSGDIPVTGEQAEARELTGYFVTLAGGIVNPNQEQAGQGVVVRFADLQDPAVKALRDEVGLPQPEGYLYVWLYPSQESLPDHLKRLFTRPNIRGLTLLTRYIIVLDNVAALDDSQRGTSLEDYQRDQQVKIFSHEYVHAYIKSILGPEKAFNLPEWYDEGLAIYFSGSSEPSSQIYMDEQGQQIWMTTAPEDYARYRDTFQFLEQEYGRERFMDLIRQSILNNEPDLLYREIGARNEQELFDMAVNSRERTGLERLGYLVIGIAGIALFITIVPRLLRKGPEFAPAISPDSLDAHYMRSRGNLRGLERMLFHQNQSLETEAVQSRLAATEALADLNDPRSVEFLSKAVREDKSSTIRAAAARGLGLFGDLQRRPAPLGALSRNHALGALFPSLRLDPAEEVRMNAAKAIYLLGGTAVVRPLEAIIRTEIRSGRISPAFQHQLVKWMLDHNQEGFVIDLYPWLVTEARRFVVERLRHNLTPLALQRIDCAMASGDRDLEELAGAVMGKGLQR